jgi:hypothetical protein
MATTTERVARVWLLVAMAVPVAQAAAVAAAAAACRYWK